ncbi:MAG TPA: chromate transporter [Rhodocyclaceae bacterium]|jgi:chromate transporter|nr:chromate transporter [Rhodocyclaceae bacterium]
MTDAEPSIAIAPRTLFIEFARMALSGFGGVMPVTRHAIVVRNQWLTEREFAELVGVAQVFPGANVVNMSVMLGWRFGGWRGSLAAISGLVLPSAVLVVCLGALYAQFADHPIVRSCVRGMAVAAAGLVIATAIKLAQSLPRTWRVGLLMVAAFVMQGVVHVPLLLIGALLIPLALWLEWRQ